MLEFCLSAGDVRYQTNIGAAIGGPGFPQQAGRKQSSCSRRVSVLDDDVDVTADLAILKAVIEYDDGLLRKLSIRGELSKSSNPIAVSNNGPAIDVAREHRGFVSEC
jgi:hypothetical protein